MTTSILHTINQPHDIKHLSKKEIALLAKEIRTVILQTVGVNGGHLASNLGVVELTIALHRVFSSPHDAIIWDVGHQSYAHKLLTGRCGVFASLRQKDGMAGFPKREESPHDIFNTGHASTSISAAEGILAARHLQKLQGKVIAVLGDGALTGGMAFEGLLNITPYTKNLVVVLNDNKMSIAANTYALSQYLSKLTMYSGYQRFKYIFDTVIEHIPVIGCSFLAAVRRVKRAVKGLFYKNNLFVDLGFTYVGPLNGHDEPALEKVFRNVSRISTPVLVHVQTKKGKGYPFAENDPSAFHGIGPFRITDGKVEKNNAESFTAAFAQSITKAAAGDDRIVAITAAMTQGTGLGHFEQLFPKRFFDVGIAEQHAVTFAAGLAAAGLRPVVAIYSTFLQRAVDQIIHDVALQNLPVIFAVDRAGAVPYDGETHQGLYDISILRIVPAMTVMAPATAVEMELMVAWALMHQCPAAIRYPKAVCPADEVAFSRPLAEGRGVLVLETGKHDVVLVCTGGLYAEMLSASTVLLRKGIYADIYNLRFLKPLDETFFLETVGQYRHIVLAEDGCMIGGIAQYLDLLIQKNISAASTAVCAFSDTIFLQGSRSDVLDAAGLTAQKIAQTVMQLCNAELRNG